MHRILATAAALALATAAPAQTVIEHDANGRPILPEALTDEAIAAFTWAVVDAVDPSVFFALPLHQVAAELRLPAPTDTAAARWDAMTPEARTQAIARLAADPFLSLSDAMTR